MNTLSLQHSHLLTSSIVYLPNIEFINLITMMKFTIDIHERFYKTTFINLFKIE